MKTSRVETTARVRHMPSPFIAHVICVTFKGPEAMGLYRIAGGASRANLGSRLRQDGRAGPVPDCRRPRLPLTACRQHGTVLY